MKKKAARFIEFRVPPAVALAAPDQMISGAGHSPPLVNKGCSQAAKTNVSLAVKHDRDGDSEQRRLSSNGLSINCLHPLALNFVIVSTAQKFDDRDRPQHFYDSTEIFSCSRL